MKAKNGKKKKLLHPVNDIWAYDFEKKENREAYKIVSERCHKIVKETEVPKRSVKLLKRVVHKIHKLNKKAIQKYSAENGVRRRVRLS